MNGKKLVYQVESPKTQSVAAVKALLAFKKVACNPLPQEVSLDDGRLVLVLSNKKDAYYVTTSRTCSCPSAVYHPGQRCKHSLKHFPEQQTAKPESSMEGDIRASLPGWRGPDGQRANGPVGAI